MLYRACHRQNTDPTPGSARAGAAFFLKVQLLLWATPAPPILGTSRQWGIPTPITNKPLSRVLGKGRVGECPALSSDRHL